MKKCNCEKTYEKMQHKKRIYCKLFQGSKRHNFSKKFNGEKSFEIFLMNFQKKRKQKFNNFCFVDPKIA
jgi:hypothetical protein